MAKSEAAAPADSVELYERVVATEPGIDRKGAKMPYTSCNGHMFSFLDKTGSMGLRLPDDALTKFQKKYKTGPNIQHGAVMREYVTVPAELLRNTKALAKYFAISVAYVGGLPPKKTAAKKKATKKTATKKTATKKTATKKKATKKAVVKPRR